MGIMTHFFMATRKEAKTLGEEAPGKRFPTCETKGIDPLTLGVLHGILTGEGMDDPEAALALVPDPILEAGGGDITVFPVDKAVVRAVAALDDDDAKEVAGQWLQGSELAESGLTLKKFMPWFGEFRRFMAEAAEKKRDVFLWVCV